MKKRISGLVKKNLWMALFILFICLGVGMSAYLESDGNDSDLYWSAAVTHVSSTATPTLGPDTGWWSAIATPTPKQ